MLNLFKKIYIQYVQGLCQSRFSTADYALFLVASLQRQSSNLNGPALDRRHVKDSYTFYVGLRLVQYCENFRLRDFV
jgi:hypothetical protein